MPDLTVESINTLELTPEEIALCRDEEYVKEDEPSPETGEQEVGEPDGGEEPGQDDAPPEPEPKDGEQAGMDAPWYSGADLALADSYGLSEKELKDFQSADEFRRTARLLDRTLLREPVQPQTPPQKLTESQPTPEEVRKLLDEKHYAEAGYDEDTIALVRHANRLQEQHAAMEARLVEMAADAARRDQANYLAAFHDSCDSLDEELYGRSVMGGRLATLPDAADANRRKLFDQAETLRMGIERRQEVWESMRQAGRPEEELGPRPEVPPLPVLLDRAEQLTFGEQLRAKEERIRQEKLAEQSKKRRPVARTTRTRSAPAPQVQELEKDDVERIANSPEIVAYWEKAQKENGA